MLIRRFFTRMLRNDDVGADGSGDTGTTIDVQATEVTAPEPEQVSQPTSMLDAVSQAIAPTAPKPEAKAPADPIPKPEDKQEPKPENPEDITKMPEGLSKPAQARFQQLANTNKELTEKYEQMNAAVLPFQQALQEHGVRKEQFDQAVQVVGLINRGDLEGALKAIDEQRRHIALALGKPLPGVDALQDFEDLRAAVDQLEITEERALEIARARTSENARKTLERQSQEQRQRQQQEQDEQTQQQALITEGLNAVDAFEKKMKAEDLDFAAVHAKLLPRLPALLNGIPPNQWAAKVADLYALIKESAVTSRQTTNNVNTLRSTGTKSPQAQPKNMMDAMFPG